METTRTVTTWTTTASVRCDFCEELIEQGHELAIRRDGAELDYLRFCGKCREAIVRAESTLKVEE